ncbi:MAG: SMP-30/gluconolactonase/LRE family protein [Pseudomonadota bacterium]
MLKKSVAGLVAVGAAYLLFWPVPIDPISWHAPANAGYVGSFAPNDGLTNVRRVELGQFTGPEDAAIGPDGAVFIATHEGAIIRYDPDASKIAKFAETGGRPLGVEFDGSGTLYVADAFLGLLKISADGDVSLLANETKSGSPIQYADDVDIAPDGTVYFTDASTRFGAKQFGGTLPASVLDLMEHSSSGRVLKYNPSVGDTTVVLEGLSFANGLAMTSSGNHYLVVETGTYSIKKVAVDGSVEPETIVENLPGFPDNINRNADGTFWVGIVSPRSDLADAISGSSASCLAVEISLRPNMSLT